MSNNGYFSVFGYSSYFADTFGNFVGAFPTLDHTKVRNVGLYTHAQIDNHLVNSTNPHGTDITQYVLQCSDIQEQTPGNGTSLVDITIHTNKLVATNPIMFSNNLCIGNSTYLLTNKIYETNNKITSTYPWAISQNFTFYFEMVNNDVFITNSKHFTSIIVNKINEKC